MQFVVPALHPLVTSTKPNLLGMYVYFPSQTSPWLFPNSTSYLLHQLRLPLALSEVAGCFKITPFSQTVYNAISLWSALVEHFLKPAWRDLQDTACFCVMAGLIHMVMRVFALYTESDCKGVSYMYN